VTFFGSAVTRATVSFVISRLCSPILLSNLNIRCCQLFPRFLPFWHTHIQCTKLGKDKLTRNLLIFSDTEGRQRCGHPECVMRGTGLSKTGTSDHNLSARLFSRLLYCLHHARLYACPLLYIAYVNSSAYNIKIVRYNWRLKK
jgi:hypothetical protein